MYVMVVGGYFVRHGETPMIKVNLRIDPPSFNQILANNSFLHCSIELTT